MTTMTTPTSSKDSKSTSASPQADAIGVETLTSWLRDMLLIREFEVRTMQ
ncbi:MAG: pyruvate dehydrogenase (acetyl-transferring) E1 component subunit alpha, partial [Planctomycetes bacterium]|nr:pyruvate dehydrogenase (acetyl-transferring) E1 component subunit alpha [Planctomycetota bacterium]